MTNTSLTVAQTQVDDASLEAALIELTKFGRPRLSLMSGGGWYCACEMRTTSLGVEFTVASDFDVRTATLAAKQCLERVQKTLQQARSTA